MTQAQQTTHSNSPAEKAIRDYLTLNTSVLGRMISSHFQIRTMDEAEKLATMLSGQFPEPQRVSTGVWELISNAIEHGNLKIDFEEKADLLQSGNYIEEIARRLRTEPYSLRLADVEFRRTRTMIRIRVSDQGAGFDFTKYFDDSRPLTGPNGRGIFIARKFSFDKVVYRGPGNVVDAIIRL